MFSWLYTLINFLIGKKQIQVKELSSSQNNSELKYTNPEILYADSDEVDKIFKSSLKKIEEDKIKFQQAFFKAHIEAISPAIEKICKKFLNDQFSATICFSWPDTKGVEQKDFYLFGEMLIKILKLKNINAQMKTHLSDLHVVEIEKTSLKHYLDSLNNEKLELITTGIYR